MEKIDILERLISIRNNAETRTNLESRGNLAGNDIKAYILQKGIEELIISIQNTCMEELTDMEEIINYKGRSFIKSLQPY